MRFYHRTTIEVAIKIIRAGFRNGVGTYLTAEEHTGVWLSLGKPLDENSGAAGDTVVELEMPIKVAHRYEWVEEGKGYREFLVPAELINSHARITDVVFEWWRHIESPGGLRPRESPRI